jgi:hypothetical protein
MIMSVVQIRIMRMIVLQRFVRVGVRMPFTIRNRFSPVQMGMMPVTMMMVMDVFGRHMRVQMFM